MKTPKNKDGMEFSFAWLFAVIIGAVILVLAIYAATKLISTGGTETSTAAAKEIGILLNPLETGFEEGKTTSFSVNTETRIYNGCDNSGNFGNQQISVSQKSFNKWTTPSIEIDFPNKYIFSGNYEEGKQFYVFSKPFFFPFKISDLIYLSSSSKKYCFIGAPENIREEITELNQDNIIEGDCPSSEDSIRVCFKTAENCDVSVKYSLKYVEKDNERIYFETDALMYGAIFSDKKSYECQVKRLMERTKELSSIYAKKSGLLAQKECNSNLDLNSFKILSGNYNDSSDLSSLANLADEIEEGNEASLCKLW